MYVAILTDSLTVATFSEQLLNEEPDRQQAECHVLPSFLPVAALRKTSEWARRLTQGTTNNTLPAFPLHRSLQWTDGVEKDKDGRTEDGDKLADNVPMDGQRKWLENKGC